MIIQSLFTLICLAQSIPIVAGITTTCNSVDSIDYSIILPTSPNIKHLENKLLEISDPNSPTYRQYLNIEQIKLYTTPDNSVRQPVFDWLKNFDVQCKDNGDSLKCSSTVEVASQMWGLNYNRRTLQGDIIVPESLTDNILFVEGLIPKKKQNVLRTRSAKNNKNYNDVSPDPGYVGLESLQHLYNFTSIKSSSSVAAIEYQGGSGFSQDDLNQNCQLNGISDDNISQVIGVDVGTDLETQLDLQMEALINTGGNIWFWDDDGWLLSFATNFFNTENVPSVISMSWGWAEDQQCTITSCQNRTSKEYVSRVNQEYIKIGLRGVTITVSSGDAGAPGRTGENCDPTRPVNPVMPGSSPWITSVSATFVAQSNDTINWKTPLCKQNDCVSGTEEYPANYNFTSWTTGGGFAEYNVRPSWQKDAVNDYLTNGVSLPSSFSKNGRGYPDISAIGHNCPVISQGMLQDIDGTSCSSPLWAGMVALLNQRELEKGKGPLGFMNPLLYKMHQEDPSLFNDVTVGNNFCTEYNCCPQRADQGSDYGYLSTKGWDPVTGLGTPNLGKMMHYIDNL